MHLAYKIRIEPDWNVNIYIVVNRTRVLSIRIEPDWNVNEEYKETLMNAIKIRIEPDWNVNFFNPLL